MKDRYYIYKYVSRDSIVYIGKTVDILTRLRQHRRCKGLDAKFKPYITDCAVFFHRCSTEQEMNILESLLIELYKPVLNVAGKTDIKSSVSALDLEWERFNEKSFSTHADSGKSEAQNRTFESVNRGLSRYNTMVKECIKDINRFIAVVHEFPSLLDQTNAVYSDYYKERVMLFDPLEYIPKNISEGYPVNILFSAFRECFLESVCVEPHKLV